jgi:hypothetical protein
MHLFEGPKKGLPSILAYVPFSLVYPYNVELSHPLSPSRIIYAKVTVTSPQHDKLPFSPAQFVAGYLIVSGKEHESSGILLLGLRTNSKTAKPFIFEDSHFR